MQMHPVKQKEGRGMPSNSSHVVLYLLDCKGAVRAIQHTFRLMARRAPTLTGTIQHKSVTSRQLSGTVLAMGGLNPCAVWQLWEMECTCHELWCISCAVELVLLLCSQGRWDCL